MAKSPPTSTRPLPLPAGRLPTVRTAATRLPSRRDPLRPNIVALRGTIVEAPSTRLLATGTVCEATVLTRSTVDGKVVREPVPVVWFDQRWEFTVGAEVIVRGRVRQRFFRSGPTTVSRTEVVADEIVLASRRTATAKLLERAVHAVHELREPARTT